MEVRTVVAKVVGQEQYVAILHWPGGVRFEGCETLEAGFAWLQKSVEQLMGEFEIVFDQKARVTARKVIVP